MALVNFLNLTSSCPLRVAFSSFLQIDLFIAKQFLFQRQWQKVREYARRKGVDIMGDMPIYVGYHSADVWANKKHFLLASNMEANNLTAHVHSSKVI